MRFHAAAPPGEWLNDPNALFFADGRYRLYAQHAADAPDFRKIGWGAFESDDLLNWRWQGPAFGVDEMGRSAYSGSMANGAIALTRHDPAGPHQSQQWYSSLGATPETFGPAGFDCRDPFIVSAETGERAIMIARPCSWQDWRDTLPSRLEIWREQPDGEWRETGTIGPWSPPGVMWEVPQLIEIDGRHVLIVSTVDRRDDGATCRVLCWIGMFADDRFAIAEGFPAQGMSLDLGPDFYAPIVNVAAGWPSSGPVVIGWASSWDYARKVQLPCGARGGPLTLPRRVGLAPDGLSVRLRWAVAPPADAVTTFRLDAHAEIRIGAHSLSLERIGRELGIALERRPLPSRASRTALHDDGDLTLSIIKDGPLIEILIEPSGAIFTALLPGVTDDDTVIVTPRPHF